MLALTVVFALGGLALGSYATYRFAPPLAGREGSVAVGLVICLLVGAATGLACMYIYLAIYGLINQPALGSALGEGARSASASPDANIFISTVFSIASESGVLLALAAGVYLLAGPAPSGEPS